MLCQVREQLLATPRTVPEPFVELQLFIFAVGLFVQHLTACCLNYRVCFAMQNQAWRFQLTESLLDHNLLVY